MLFVEFFYGGYLLHMSCKQMRLRFCLKDAMRFRPFRLFLLLDRLVIYLLNFFLWLLRNICGFYTFVVLFGFWTWLRLSRSDFGFYLIFCSLALAWNTGLKIIVKISCTVGQLFEELTIQVWVVVFTAKGDYLVETHFVIVIEVGGAGGFLFSLRCTEWCEN